MAVKKTTSRKRVQRKNIERGAATFSQHLTILLLPITDMQGNAISWRECRRPRFQRFKTGYSLCCTDGC